MQAIHHNVTRAKTGDNGRKVSRFTIAIDVNDQGGFARVIEALADADTKEGGVLPEEPATRLPFHGEGLRERSGRDHWCSTKSIGERCGAEGDGVRGGGDDDGSHPINGLRNGWLGILVDIDDHRGFSGTIAALSNRHAQDCDGWIYKHARGAERLLTRAISESESDRACDAEMVLSP